MSDSLAIQTTNIFSPTLHALLIKKKLSLKHINYFYCYDFSRMTHLFTIKLINVNHMQQKVARNVAC